MSDNALKAIRVTDDELVVGNYIVLFGGRDLEGIASDKSNEDGSRGEFFTAKTALDSDYTKTGRLLVDWEHGNDPDQLAEDEPAPGRDNVLGYVDWSTAKADQKGVFVERVLNRHNAYMQFLESLIDEGIIGTSSEAVPSDVEIGEDGEIKSWPLRRDALTVTPMEPRMKTENVVHALKSLAGEFPDVTTLADAVAGLETGAEAGENPAPTVTAATVDVNINIRTDNELSTVEGETMSDEKEKAAPVEAPAVDLEAMIQKAVGSAVESVNQAWQEKLKSEPPVNAEKAGFAVVGDEADRALEGNPFKSLGEFMMAVKRAGISFEDKRLLPLKSNDALFEGGYDMAEALGSQAIGRLSGMKAPTGLGELVAADGGYLVGTDRAPGFMARVYENGSLLQRVAMFPVSTGGNSMTFYGEDETSRADGSRRGGARAYWAAEASEKTASQPKFREMELKLRKVIGLVYATDELLNDAATLESYLLQVFPEELRFVVEDAIFNGTGAGQPLGILNSGALISVAKESGQAASTIVAENIIKMWARMWAPARRNAAFYINQDVEPQLHQLNLPVGTGGQLVYMPPGGLSASPYGTIYGRPVIPVEYCPTLGTVGDVLLADLSQYYMIEKGGIDTASSIHVRFVYDETCFRFVYRVDGQPAWSAPLTPKSGSNTLSPFVALATRA